MKILSWNIWFDPRAQEKRTNLLIKYILEINADIVCLQEVIPQVYDEIKKGLKRKYKFFSDRDLLCARTYGEIILYKKKFKLQDSDIFRYENSVMGRVMNFIQVEDIVISTSHLESLWSYSEQRQEQLLDTLEFLDVFDHVIWIGDSNFSDRGKDKPDLSKFPDYSDVYLGVDDPKKIIKYTYDGIKNKYISGKYRSRLDRAFVKGLEVKDYQLMGIENECSDHFGLLVEVEKN